MYATFRIYMTWHDIFQSNTVWHMICRHTYVMESSRKWHHCPAVSHVYGLIMLVVIIIQLTYSPLQQFRLLLPKLVRKRIYITFCNPSGKSVKDSGYWREIRHNKPTWNCERIVDMCSKVGLARISIYTVHDNADRISESAKSGTKVFV